MRIKTSFILVFIVFIMAARAVFAETPHEQLKQMVQQLQKNPTDNALREKIIKLAQELKPTPAVPEEAERYLARGNALLQDAKGPDDANAAVKEYQSALTAAPWWGDTYYNLSIAQELARDFDGAVRSLQFYLLTGPQDKREAQNRIYALEAKKEKAAKDTAKATEEEAKKREEFVQNLAGTWFFITSAGSLGIIEREREYGRHIYQMSITSKNAFTMSWRRKVGGIGGVLMPYSETLTGTVTGTRINGNISLRVNYRPWHCGIVDLSGTFDGTISGDGKKIRLTVSVPRYDIETCSNNGKYDEYKEFTKE